MGVIMHPYIYLYIHVYVYTHTSTYRYTITYSNDICICVCIYVYVHIYMHTWKFMCVRACIHSCMRASVFLRARVCIRRRARDAQFLQELALAEPLGERLHLRGEDGPAAHRARVPARARRVTMGGRGVEPGRSHGKETTHALNTHPHARDRHTGAFGAATVP